MPELLDLSNEILTQILRYEVCYDANHREDLREFALVCRVFYNLVSPLLFEEFSVAIGPNEIPRFSCLVRSLAERPVLASYIRYISVSWFLAEAKTHSNINDFLSKLHCLQEMSIQAGGTDIGSEPIPFHPEFLDRNSMPMLRSLAVGDDDLTPEAIAQYIFIESLKELRVSKTAFPESFVLPEALSQRKCNVTKLHIGSWDESDMRRLLGWTNSLKKLDCISPGIPDAYSEDMTLFDRYYGPDFFVSSARTLRALSPVLNSLEDLHLSSCGVRPQYVDETQLDLSMALRLKRLYIPASSVFPPGKDFSGRMGFYKLLPFTIERLEIQFAEGGHRIITPLRHFVSSEHFPTAQMKQIADVAWVLELLAHKHDSTPNLIRVSLNEESRTFDDYGMEFSRNWNLPPAVEAATLEASTWLSISVGQEKSDAY